MLARAGTVLQRYPVVHRALRRLWFAGKYPFHRREGIRRLTARYERMFGCPPNLDEPVTFTGKLFRRMIRWHESGCGGYTDLADKLRVRAFVADRVGDRYLSSIYWQGRNPRDIPFDMLPERYVLKTNHGSAHVIVVTGPIDRNGAVAELQQWLSKNHYWKEYEYQYLHIRPRVYVEEFLDDGQEAGPLDYRFWCFDGSPRLVQVDNHLHDINPFYDVDWNPVDLSYRSRARPVTMPRPSTLEEMTGVARRLAKGFGFVRVDLFSVGERVVFGELTFTPVAGSLVFQPARWDEELGAMWTAYESDSDPAGFR